jgi:hypothetical protein
MKPSWYRKRILTVQNEFDRDAVRHVQRVLSLEETGELDERTVMKIRGLQYIFSLPMTGYIDDATAEEVERIFPRGA